MLEELADKFFHLKGIRSSFDFYLRVGKQRFLIKRLTNLDGVERTTSRDLYLLAAMLNAIPLIIADHTNTGRMRDDLVYIRWKVPALTEKGFSQLLNGKITKIKYRRIFYVKDGDHQRLPIKNTLTQEKTHIAVKLKVPSVSLKHAFLSSPVKMIVKDEKTNLVDFNLSPPTRRKKEAILKNAGRIIGFKYVVLDNPNLFK
jgi:hypothetical protein